MTDGNPTGVVAADPSSSVNAAPSGSWDATGKYTPTAETLWRIVLWLQAEGEWQAERVLQDAINRWESRKVCEGQRGREGVDGQDSQEAR